MGTKIWFKWPKKITPSLVVKLIRAEKDLQKAKLLFDSATAEYSNGFKHDHTTFGVMISKLVSANQFRPAEELLSRMKEEQCRIREDIFRCIFLGYGRVHRPLDVIRLFEMMGEFECKPTEKSYITVLDILVGESQLRVAIRFYRYMKKMGIPVSVVSLNVLIKGLCKNSGTMDAAIGIFREMPRRGCNPDAYTYGTLINGFCRLGKISEARELFKEMEIQGCLASVVTYTSLIHGLCQSDKVDEAMELLEKMNTKGIEPNVFTYSSLMDGLCKHGCSSKAMEVFEMMVSKRHKPNMITYSTLINGLCGEGKLLEAVKILDRMKLQGLKPDAGLYGKIIKGFCDLCKFWEAANFLDEMLLGGVSPNRLTWSIHVRINNSVVQGLCDNGNPNRAFQLYLSMRTRGISVDDCTFTTLVKHFCNKGDMHKAARIVQEMTIDGCVPDEATWSGLVGGFWERRKVREAFEELAIQLMTIPDLV
ncbi:hypothetical protein K2173_000809 [Erythroxylum novogranatense]|uniref:Pentatricopeptide repeat-containing protein n=1 Tax=Erythroxylum novogranatense TaxID=1862640 RepID=A0AAV8T4D7_9ROSI|nr:hypothetical protein K2173_000809 [Erythroxylum novogranatense]